MWRRTGFFPLATLWAAMLFAQKLPQSKPPAAGAVEEVDFVCPMDPDVHQKNPGKCPRCGMKLVAGIPDPHEYPVQLSLAPRNVQPAQQAQLAFEVLDPKTKQRVRRFQVVHEKLFHLFVVKDDLSFFAHEHPEMGKDAIFRYSMAFPKGGGYRVLTDFYPDGGTPQLVAKTILVPGAEPFPEVKLEPSTGPQHGANMDVELVTEPPQPIAGFKTLLFFRLKPGDGLEQYLGAWGHMLAASSDLIDTIHTHPFLADGGPQVQFNLIFPREGTYRLWVQFQRKGVVNTVAFNVPVIALK